MHKMMRYLLLLSFVTLCATVNIWPYPASIDTEEDADTIYVLPSLVNWDTAPECVLSYVSMLQGKLFPISVVSLGVTQYPRLARVEFEVSQSEQNAIVPFSDESYTLTVSSIPNNYAKVKIEATTCAGAIRGLESFAQLVTFSRKDSAYVMSNSLPLLVKDHPRFPWRGLLVDSARHFLPLDTIFHAIDGLAAAKMNVLHWHITDASAFAFQSETYPNLSKDGAYAPYAAYTHANVTDVLKYAKERAVHVVVEVDTPGHCYSWGKGYPDLVADCPSFEANINNIPLNPTKNETYDFVENLFREMFGVLFNVENSAFFHVGGDEVVQACWAEDPQINEFLQQKQWSTKQLFQYYLKRLVGLVHKVGAEMKTNVTIVGWEELYDEEIVTSKDIDDVIIHSWKDKNSLYGAAHDGFYTILSTGWYLDQQIPSTEHHYLWEDTWMDFYVNEPLDAGPFTLDEAARVLGGEAAMWGEQVDMKNFDSRVWPRTAAVAERLWSSRSKNDTSEAKERLMEYRCSLAFRGFDAGPIAPDFCESLYVLQNEGNECPTSSNGGSSHKWSSSDYAILFGVSLGTLILGTLVSYAFMKRRYRHEYNALNEN